MHARLLPVVTALAVAAPPAAAEPRLVFALDDPAGDATGPGTYVPPTEPGVGAADFDLRRFAVLVDGEDVLLEVTLGAPIRAAGDAARAEAGGGAGAGWGGAAEAGAGGGVGRRAAAEAEAGAGAGVGVGVVTAAGAGAGAAATDLASGLVLQNVDVYVDTDATPGSGVAACLPGRRVGFAEGRTWERAVVLTPRPGPARAVVAAALGDEVASRVIFPAPLALRGATIVARVPAAALGGPPRREWGWSVHVSGARLEGGDTAPAPGAPRGAADAFTLPVLPAAGPRAFGGAPAGEAHPRVVDVLLPAGVDQAALLGGFDAAAGALARVPFVVAPPAPFRLAGPDALAPRLAASPLAVAPPGPPLAPAPPRPAAAPAPGAAAGPILTVAEIAEDVATLAGPNIGLAPQQVGRVVDRDGTILGRVVIEKVLENGAVARIVSGRENVRWGARVRFDVGPPRR